jgi:hypothetical protein
MKKGDGILQVAPEKIFFSPDYDWPEVMSG